MTLRVLGVSGSTIKNSNTDRAIKAILEAGGLESEFVKLSEINVRPCRACKQCVPDNICKQEDDFPELAKKVLEAQALVIGAYCPYGMVDAYTKAFLERLWSMRHVRGLNEGMLGVIVVSGILPSRSNPLLKVAVKLAKNHIPLNKVPKNIEHEMKMEGMNVIGTVKINGNVPCLTCGNGTDCKKSGVTGIFGKGTVATSDLCVAVEDQPEVWSETIRIGKLLRDHLL